MAMCGSATRPGKSIAVSLSNRLDSSQSPNSNTVAYVYLRALGIEPPPFWERWWNLIHLPMINAAMELSHGKPARAIELLQPVAFYERLFQVSADAWARLPRRPPRGGSGRGVPKILAVKSGNSVLVFPGLLYPLTYLGLAPAEALSGDVGKAKKCYQHLFTLWKDTDPDLEILARVHQEFAVLR